MSISRSSLLRGGGDVMPNMIRRWTVSHRWWHSLMRARHEFYLHGVDVDAVLVPQVNGESMLEWLDENCHGRVVVSAVLWAGITSPRMIALHFTHRTDAVAAKLFMGEYAID